MTIPSLEQVFGDNEHLMRAFSRANITSVVTLMTLPRELLLNDIDGIGEYAVQHISRQLAAHNLEHRAFTEKLPHFIARLFGSIEDAPVAVLNTVLLRSALSTQPQGTVTCRAHYAPIQLLQLVEEIDPQFSVEDILNRSETELITLLSQHFEIRPIRVRLQSDVKDINWRLNWWNHKLHVGCFRSQRQPIRELYLA